MKIQGGLGNQLFCLAFAHSVAHLTGAPVALDLASFSTDRYGRRFALEPLAARLGLTFSRRPILSNPITKRLAGALWPPFIREGPPPCDRAALASLAARGRYFDGYWQNEAWISEPRELMEAVRSFAEQGGPARELVLHYRTYKEETRPERRATPPAGYFERAVSMIEARGGPVGEIVLVSDDPALAMERIGALARRARPAPAASALADLAALMNARNLVLSNSSFSWWGGFCSRAERVLYPSRGELFHYPAPARRFEVV